MKIYCFSFYVFLSSFILNAQQSDFKHINFKKADSIAQALQGASLNNLPFLAHKLTHNLNTQVEQFRAIHTWVCSNIEADHYFGDKTIRKRKKFKNDSVAFANWNKEELSGLYKRLKEHKKTICSGYAYLIKELSALTGITSRIVDGYSRTVSTNLHEMEIPNHSWNVVLLDGKWYVADATLASGFYFVNENRFVKDYNDGYFLADPNLFAKNHFPLEKKWLLTSTQLSTSEFVQAPLIYGKTYKYGVIPVLPSKLLTRVVIDDAVLFSLKIPNFKLVDTISMFVSGGLTYEKIQASVENYDNGLLTFSYRFTKKGRYDVHIRVDKDVLISYTVEVT